jgi:hypothetical protein
MLRPVESFTRITDDIQSLNLTCGHGVSKTNDEADKVRFAALTFRERPVIECPMCSDVPTFTPAEAERLIRFVAAMCWNMAQVSSFDAQVEGHEAAILAEFKKGVHPWEAVEVLPEDNGDV